MHPNFSTAPGMNFKIHSHRSAIRRSVMSKLRLRLQQRLALQPSTLNPNRFARSGAVRSPVRFGPHDATGARPSPCARSFLSPHSAIHSLGSTAGRVFFRGLTFWRNPLRYAPVAFSLLASCHSSFDPLQAARFSGDILFEVALPSPRAQNLLLPCI